MIWIPVGFCLVAVLGSLAYAAFRGLRLWRTARAEERALGLTEKSERLTAATERLQESLAELSAIRRAAAEPQALLRSLRSTVPRK